MKYVVFGLCSLFRNCKTALYELNWPTSELKTLILVIIKATEQAKQKQKVLRLLISLFRLEIVFTVGLILPARIF